MQRQPQMARTRRGRWTTWTVYLLIAVMLVFLVVALSEAQRVDLPHPPEPAFR